MWTRDIAASQLAFALIRAWAHVAEYAHQSGVDDLYLPGASKPATPKVARSRIVSGLKDSRLDDAVVRDAKRIFPSQPREWSSRRTLGVQRDIEAVETLAWACSLRSRFPSFTGVTPSACSIARVLWEVGIDAWWQDVEPRPASVIARKISEAAAWRWRAYAEYYRRMPPDKRPVMRRYSKAVRALLPTAVAHAKSKKWIPGSAYDFPVREPGQEYCDAFAWEIAELEMLASARLAPLRGMLEPGQGEVSAPDAWDLMFAPGKAPPHPPWPF